MKPGDIVKVNYNGKKNKYEVLGFFDKITDGSIYLNLPLSAHEYPDSTNYNKDMENITKNDFKNMNCYNPLCIGDFISEHFTRMYLKPISIKSIKEGDK